MKIYNYIQSLFPCLFLSVECSIIRSFCIVYFGKQNRFASELRETTVPLITSLFDFPNAEQFSHFHEIKWIRFEYKNENSVTLRILWSRLISLSFTFELGFFPAFFYSNFFFFFLNSTLIILDDCKRKTFQTSINKLLEFQIQLFAFSKRFGNKFELLIFFSWALRRGAFKNLHDKITPNSRRFFFRLTYPNIIIGTAKKHRKNKETTTTTTSLCMNWISSKVRNSMRSNKLKPLHLLILPLPYPSIIYIYRFGLFEKRLEMLK